MKDVTRRRFVQFAAAAGSQGRAILGWTIGLSAGAVLAGCRSLRDLLVRPKRWVFPSVAGDFVIHTAHDPDQLREFPVFVRAQRVQFPAVAATILKAEDPGEIDSDQVELINVWVRIDAPPKTRLFRERDVVRADVLRSAPSGNFSLAVSPHHLLPEFAAVVPFTLEARDKPRWTRWATTEEVDQLLHFEFCVRPDECSDPCAVGSTLPTVVARWPRKIDLLIRSRYGEVRKVPLSGMLTETPGNLLDCGGPSRDLRWVVARYSLDREIELSVWQHPGGHESYVKLAPQTLTVRLRPGFVDLLIPDGSVLTTTGSPPASVDLVHSHCHAANRYAFSWISALPAETTPLPAELCAAFCLASRSSRLWPLTPDPISLPANGSRIAFEVKANQVSRSRAAVTMARKGLDASRSLEQQFEALSLTFESDASSLQRRIELVPTPGPHGQQKWVTHAVFDTEGRIASDEANIPLADSLLVVDLFMRPKSTQARDKALDITFHEVSGRLEVLEGEFFLVTGEVGWAGRQARRASAGDWVYLQRVPAAPGDHDYRGEFVESLADLVVHWDLKRDRFRVIKSAAQIVSTSEIVSLSAQAFRAALPAVFPRQDGPQDNGVWLPPFGLREHRGFTIDDACSGKNGFKWEDDTNPAFRDLTMWEPRTSGQVEEPSDSPSEFFASFAASEGGASVRWAVYAGFGIDGSLGPLKTRAWAPDATCHREVLAPYRAISASGIHPVQGANPSSDAVDVTDLCNEAYRSCYREAFLATDARYPSLQRVARDSGTEIALSPIGGSIAYDWTYDKPKLGLRDLTLHGWLGRYQKNFAIFADLLLPYGIRISILNLTARQDSGELRYCTKWWFAETEKAYGDGRSIVIDNLRPINAVNFNPNEPLLFKADIHHRSGMDQWVDRDRTLQGIGLITAKYSAPARKHLKQTVALARPQALTCFRSTPLRLSHVEWVADPLEGEVDPSRPCKPPAGYCGAESPRITVTARGELEQVAGMSYDTRAAEAVFVRSMDADTGEWCRMGGEESGDQAPLYASRSLTLGDGVVRIDRPLRRSDTFELSANAEHKLEKKITLRDVGLMQLIQGGDGDDEFLKNEGTLTIRQKLLIRDRQENRDATSTREERSEAEVEAVLDFPEFSKGVGEVCAGGLSFRLKVVPRSFHASFKKTLTSDPTFDAVLKADMGVPGLLVLRDCELRSRSGESVVFKPGNLEPCGELLKVVFEIMLDKLKDLLGFGGSGGSNSEEKKSPFQFSALTDPFGFLVNLRLPFPRIAFGVGFLENLTFDFRLALAIDISKAGLNCGSMFAFILGDYPVKGFGDIPWLKIRIGEVGMRIFKKLRPPTLTITPYTIRFSTIIAVRVRLPEQKELSLPDDPFKAVCFDAVACISGEGGLALAFDTGVANGTVSITIGIVWCPQASYSIDLKSGKRGDEYFSFDEIALVARIELKASVLRVANVFVRVEAMAQLKLTCDSILTHLEVSGVASIEMSVVTVDVAFTVDMDPLLGIDPNACPRDKGAPARCAWIEPTDTTRVALADFFKHVEVAA